MLKSNWLMLSNADVYEDTLSRQKLLAIYCKKFKIIKMELK